MKRRTVLYAEDGYVLTDGEIYGTVIYLADGETEDDFHEITAAEFEEIERRKKEEALM